MKPALNYLAFHFPPMTRDEYDRVSEAGRFFLSTKTGEPLVGKDAVKAALAADGVVESRRYGAYASREPIDPDVKPAKPGKDPRLP